MLSGRDRAADVCIVGSGDLTFSGGGGANIITHRAGSGALKVTAGGASNAVIAEGNLEADVRLFGGSNGLDVDSSGFTKAVLGGGTNIVSVTGAGDGVSGGSDLAVYGAANIIATDTAQHRIRSYGAATVRTCARFR